MYPARVRRRRRLLAAAVLAGLAADPAAAREVSFPMPLDLAFVRERVVSDLFDGPGESAKVSADATGCNEVALARPKLSGRDGLLHLATDFDASLGFGFGGWCWTGTRQRGVLDAGLEARLHPKLPIVEFRVVDSKIYDEAGVERFTGPVWDWVRAQVHPQLETIRVDLHKPITELKVFAPALFPGGERTRIQHLMDSISLSDVAISADAITVRVRLDVPPEPAPPPSLQPAEPEAPLTEQELARWDSAWQSWDAFLTFLVKQSSREGDDALRAQLRDVLLAARYDIVDILQSSEARETDPVRPLFLETWPRLAPILRRLSTHLPGESALHYLSLIAAADLFEAISQLGPGYGVELSSDGLRRMARLVAEGPLLDPTAYGEGVDTELRSLFGFGPPLEIPPAEAEEPEPPAPAVPVPPAEPPPMEPPPAPIEPQSLLRLPFEIRRVGVTTPPRSLERWVPTLGEVGEYLPRVREMLGTAALRTQRAKALPDRYAPLFRHLVLTTAWQESCWRQFVVRGGQRQTLTSRVGALGIMQVNARVWRGFYDVPSLRDSPQYNAEAGSEILHHYLVDYAIKRREDEVRKQQGDLARATYSAYNAGPRQLARYRRPHNGKPGHPIDAGFWAKFQKIQSGNELAVRACFPGASV
jgi:hypothetical protein